MAFTKTTTLAVIITPPNFKYNRYVIQGTHPLVMAKWSEKVKDELQAKQAAGSTSTIKKKQRTAKDFTNWEQFAHKSTDGWYGIPCTALRAAMISACRVAGLQMTRAKLAVFVQADGFEKDGTPLVKIIKGEPYSFTAPVKNATGVVDLRVRPRWNPGWQASVTIQYDADVLDAASVTNLLARAGVQVGLLEGRPDSKQSTGQDWGRFKIATEEEISDDNSQ